MCGFIAQLVERRTGIAEVTGANPVGALIFFRLLLSNCLSWKINCMIILHLLLLPHFKYELFQIHFTTRLISSVLSVLREGLSQYVWVYCSTPSSVVTCITRISFCLKKIFANTVEQRYKDFKHPEDGFWGGKQSRRYRR